MPVIDAAETKEFAQKKTTLLAAIFSLVIFTYSIIKPLKDTIFLSLVGKEYIPMAKLILIALTPLFMLGYSYAIRNYRKHHAAMFFIGIYSVLCIVFALVIRHPILGLANTTTAPNRVFGWVVYSLLDLYSVSIVATIWGLTSSISNPKNAHTQYGIMVASSRVGGIMAALTGGVLFHFFLPTTSASGLLVVASCSLLGAMGLIYRLFTTLPKSSLQGYSKKNRADKTVKQQVGLWQGLKEMVAQPYSFGIFTLVASYELISTLINFRSNYLIAEYANNCAKTIGMYSYGHTFATQIIGLSIAMFGTTYLPKKIGFRACLLLTPCVLLGFSLLHSISSGNNLNILLTMLIAMRGLHYGFNVPMREMLYIPTSKNIQFVTRGWISSFGKTLSKASGSVINMATILPGFAALAFIPSILISIIWIVTASAIGKKYQDAIDTNQVIGDKTSSIS